MLQTSPFQQLFTPQETSETFPMYSPQQIQTNYMVPNIYPQNRLPLTQTSQADHFFLNDQQHQHLQMQFIPQKPTCYQLQNHLIDAESQIQQEIQNLENLKLELRFRQQQLVQNFSSQGSPVQNVIPTQNLNNNQQNNNFLNSLKAQRPNQLQIQNSMNIQNNNISYSNVSVPNSVYDITAEAIIKKTQKQYQQMMMNEQFLHQQQLQMIYGKTNQDEEEITRRKNSSSCSSQQQTKLEQFNRKRSIIDINSHYPHDQFSLESFSYETVQNQINKKICSEENKLSTSSRQRSTTVNLLQSQSNHQDNYNQLQCQLIKNYPEYISNEIINPNYTQIKSLSQNSITQNNSEASYVQYKNTLSNCGMINNYSLDQSLLSNTAPINNIRFNKDYSFETSELKEKQEGLNQQEQISSDNNEQNDKKTKKKEIQNDSNYTKNLLKGFKRHMNKKLQENKEEFDKFQSYFYNNRLSNEFILALLENSSYQAEFDDFLQEDPSWWMNEAKIKDTQRQLNFFEKVKNKDYTQIRTKKRSKSSPEQNQNASAGDSSNNNTNIEINQI